jgi:exopolyphosphatase / guanosine-5'-triphosphate,3'-diphosphate pyrophosphatase
VTGTMKRNAVIDLGTNTCNLLIADQLTDGSFKTLYDRKLPVKLGRGGIHRDILLPDAIGRGINAFESHAETIRMYNVDGVKVVATSAIRGASNKSEFLAIIKDMFGWDIEVIKGDREAELIFKGVRLSLSPGIGKYLILDIGGGSNEFILADEDDIIWKKSFNIGIARVLEILKISDPILPDEIVTLEAWFAENLRELWEICNLYHPPVLVGCSGAFDTFMDIYEQAVPDLKIRRASELPLEAFRQIHDKLIHTDFESRSAMKGMDKIRVEMIVVASVFTNFILDKLNIQKLIHTHYALKEGVMAELILNKL